MKLLFALFAPLLLVLGGCSAIGPVPGTTELTKSTLADEKALYVAEAAYNTLAVGYLSAVDSEALQGENKVKAKAALLKAFEHLSALRSAYRLGDAATFAAQLAEFNMLKRYLEGIF